MKASFFARGAALCVLSALLVSCARRSQPLTIIALDTVCSVNAFEDGTKKLYDEIEEALYNIEDTFDATDSNSRLSAINAAAGIGPSPADESITELLLLSEKVGRGTGGAFSPLLGPVIDLWGINTAEARVPDAREIEEALSLTKAEDLEVTGGTVFLKKRGMKLDLGGIAKGYACDVVRGILEEHAVKRAIIDLGGNIAFLGRKEDGTDWICGIKDPNSPNGEPLLKLETAETSVVTSGVYERYFEKDGRRYHHILDPATGRPAESGVLSMTVISPSSTLADALSTALLVLGADETFSLSDTLRRELGADLSFIAICGDGSVYASRSLEGSLSFFNGAGRKISYR